MPQKLAFSGHVLWNSEAGRVSASIIRIHGRVHASKGHRCRPGAKEDPE